MRWFDWLLVLIILAGLLFFTFRLGHWYGRYTVYSQEVREAFSD